MTEFDRYIPEPIGYIPEPGILETPSRADHVHAIEVEDWAEPDLLNGWASYTADLGGYDHQGVRYLRDPMGFVHLEGGLVAGTIVSGTVIFILPVGYRPVNRHICLVGTNSTDNTSRILIHPNGNVSVQNMDASGINVFLTSIVFEANRDEYFE